MDLAYNLKGSTVRDCNMFICRPMGEVYTVGCSMIILGMIILSADIMFLLSKESKWIKNKKKEY